MNRLTAMSIAAVTATAFAVGCLTAPAGAGVARLTKGKVEKIAAGVVDKKASSLTVARAATADRATTAGNALKLAGQDPSSYQTFTWSINSVDLVTAPAGGITWTLDDVPEGSYLLQYDLSFGRPSGTAPIRCSMTFTNANHAEPLLAVSSSSTNTVSGSGVIGFAEGRKARLGCGVSTGQIVISQPDVDQSSISLTKIQQSQYTDVTAQVYN